MPVQSLRQQFQRIALAGTLAIGLHLAALGSASGQGIPSKVAPGTSFLALHSGRSCGSSQLAESCDPFAFTTTSDPGSDGLRVIWRLACGHGGQSITPCSDTIRMSTRGIDSTYFDVENLDGHDTQSYSTSCTSDVHLGCTTSPTVVLVPLGASQSFKVRLSADSMQRVSTVSVSAGSFVASLVVAVTGVRVTPDTGALTRPPHRPFIASFVVRNASNTTDTYALSATCTNVDVCGTPSISSVTLASRDSAIVQVGYTTAAAGSGFINLKALSTAGALLYDAGRWQINVAPAMTVTTEATNQEMQDVSLCAASCFAAAYQYATTAYTSFDAPRNVSLNYHGDRVAVRPFIHADVSVLSGTGLQGYTLQAQVDWTGTGTWTNVQFLNGEQVLHFKADTSHQVRLSGQLDASTQSTGAYPLRIIVTGQFPNSVTESVTDSTHRLLVVNERASPIARGWRIGGVPRIVDLPNISTTIIEGDGSARVYRFTNGDAQGTSHYRSPDGDYSDLSWGGIHPNTFVRTYADSSKQVFSQTGQLTYIVDRYGRRIDYAYDVQGRLTQVGDPFRTQPGGGTRTYITLNYGSYGLASIAEPGPTGIPGAGRVTSIVIAGDSTLTSIKDPDNIFTKFTYDAKRRLSGVIDRRGDTSSFAYASDSSWKLSSISLPSVVVDSNGATITRAPKSLYATWDTAGVPYGPTSTTAKTPPISSMILASVTDPAGHKTTMAVDRWGQPLQVTDPIGGVLRITRTGIFATTIVHPDSSIEMAEYTNGLLTRYQPPGGSWIHYHYGAFAQVDSMYGTSTIATGATLGPLGSVTKVRAGGHETSFFYDGLYRDTLVIDPAGHRVRIRYDGTFGNQDSALTIGATSNRIMTVKKIFDAYGRDSINAGTNLPTVVTVYDKMNRPISVTDGVHPSPVVIGYDPMFQIRVQDQKGQIYRREVNALGLVTRLYDPADTTNRYSSYRYNIDGLLIGLTNRRGSALTNKYDALHRLVSKHDATAPTDSFYFSPNYRLVVGTNSVSTDSVFFGVGRSNMTADSAVTWLGGKRFRRYYRLNGLEAIDSLNVSMGSTGTIDFAARRFFYNANNARLDSVAVDSQKTRFHYNADGLLDSSRFAFGASRIDSLTSQHTISKTRFTTAGLDTMLYRAYTYDSAGRILEEVRKSAGIREARDFTYDHLGELTRSQKSTFSSTKTCSGNKDDLGCSIDTTITPYATTRYVYDSVGNLRTEVDSAGVTNTFATAVGNRLLGMSQGAQVDSVDLDGNRIYESTSTGSRRFTWSAGGKLQSVSVGGRTTSYEYNSFGELVRRKINGVADRQLLWDNGQLLIDMNGTATSRISEYAYVPGSGEPLTLITGAIGSKAYHNFNEDEMGSVIGIMSNSTNPDLTLRYSPWGEVESRVGALADSSNRLRWKSLVWEGDSTRLYYVKARWYDPHTHRFISEDPLGLDVGLNQYVFAGDDPINGEDPSGLDPCTGDLYDPAKDDGTFESDCVYAKKTAKDISDEVDWALFLAGLPSLEVRYTILIYERMQHADDGGGKAARSSSDYYKNQCVSAALASNAASIGIDALGLIPEVEGITRLIGHSYGLRGAAAASKGAKLVKNVGGAGSLVLGGANFFDFSLEGAGSTALTIAGFVPGWGSGVAAISLGWDVVKTIRAVRACTN